MCARFFRHGVSWADYRAAMDLLPPANVDPPEPTYNAAPMSLQPVIRPREHGEEGWTLAPMTWSLIPSWWKKPLSEKKFTSFNAKCETLKDKPVFRGAYKYRRCLVPISGFYEWTGQKGAKVPFAISLRNRRWFCLAGLWDRAMIEGSEIESFTVVTTTPNDLMAGLHTRMPVILKPEDYRRWLEPGSETDEGLFEPFPSEDMHAWVVGPEVGNVRNNHAGLIEEA